MLSMKQLDTLVANRSADNPLKSKALDLGNEEGNEHQLRNRRAARLFRQREEEYINQLRIKAQQLESMNRQLMMMQAQLTSSKQFRQSERQGLSDLSNPQYQANHGVQLQQNMLQVGIEQKVPMLSIVDGSQHAMATGSHFPGGTIAPAQTSAQPAELLRPHHVSDPPAQLQEHTQLSTQQLRSLAPTNQMVPVSCSAPAPQLLGCSQAQNHT